jgi:lipid II:glycine glycyltransferase (peptidoglycan interpeptide bridge formation enzyme)
LRYHKTAERKGLTIKKTKNPEEIKHLIKLQNALARKKGINTFPESYLKTELSQPFATLYLAEYRNQGTKGYKNAEMPTIHDKLLGKPEIVAAGLVFDDETTRYNMQGAQSDLGHHLHATGILTIELIKDAREKGLKFFDFWGIAPEGAPDDHPWATFTSFKKTFHGEPRHYLGTYDLPLNLAKYESYKMLRGLNRIKRKVIAK